MDFNISTALLIGILIFLAYRLVKEHFLIKYCKYKDSKGEIYNIQCNYKDKEEAADILAKLNNNAHTLINYLKKKYYNSKSDRGFLTRNLVDRYKGKSRLVETDPNNKEGDTSFTLDKGYLLSLCIRCSKDKDKTCFHKYNILNFVLIHELGHIAADVQNHPERYWSVFKWLLKESIEAGIYTYQDYAKDPIDYCSLLNVTYTPLDDNSLEPISSTKYYVPNKKNDTESKDRGWLDSLLSKFIY